MYKFIQCTNSLYYLVSGLLAQVMLYVSCPISQFVVRQTHEPTIYQIQNHYMVVLVAIGAWENAQSWWAIAQFNSTIAITGSNVTIWPNWKASFLVQTHYEQISLQGTIISMMWSLMEYLYHSYLPTASAAVVILSSYVSPWLTKYWLLYFLFQFPYLASSNSTILPGLPAANGGRFDLLTSRWN